MALWVILGLYVGLLVLAWKKIEPLPGRIVVLTILLSPAIWVIGESSVGYYKFKQACEVESGLKIFIENPPPAKRLRLEGGSFGFSGAEFTLKSYPALQQIEASDDRVNVIPPAYAVYERGPNGKVVPTLMDKVGRQGGHGETKVFESAPSQAEYVISKTRDHLPYRLNKLQHVLRDKEGRLVATVTAFGYTDTDPNRSLLRMPWGRAAGCGPSEREMEMLINQIASPK